MGKSFEACRVYFNAAVFCVGWHEASEAGQGLRLTAMWIALRNEGPLSDVILSDSEGSHSLGCEILRFTQDDKRKGHSG